MFQERELLPYSIIPTDLDHVFWNQIYLNLNLASVIYWLCDFGALSYLNSMKFIFLTNLKWIESTLHMIVVKIPTDNIDHSKHIIHGQ